MSDTFKFLKQQAEGPKDQPFAPAGQSGPDAAQDFLAKQMAKNKFLDTAQPVENVGKHLTTDPYAYGEGTVPGGEGYKDQQVVLNQKEIDDWHAANPDYKEGGGSPGKGKLSAEQIREKFGLDFNEAHAKESHSNVQKGSAVANSGALYVKGDYIGTIKGFSKQDPDDPHPGAGGIASLQAIDQYAYDNKLAKEDGKVWMSTGWNSYNDVAGAVRAVYGEPEEVKEPPAKKMGIKPIEHSQEIKQAKERVKTWEQGIESGQTSKEIFGNASFMDKYQQDFSKGAEGIGTNAASSGQESANSATQSFLDNKVSQVKKTLSPA